MAAVRRTEGKPSGHNHVRRRARIEEGLAGSGTGGRKRQQAGSLQGILLDLMTGLMWEAERKGSQR